MPRSVSLTSLSARLFQIKLVNIRPDDIVDGNPKLTLGLVWTIILHFQVSPVPASAAGRVLSSGQSRPSLQWEEFCLQISPAPASALGGLLGSAGLVFSQRLASSARGRRQLSSSRQLIAPSPSARLDLRPLATLTVSGRVLSPISGCREVRWFDSFRTLVNYCAGLIAPKPW